MAELCVIVSFSKERDQLPVRLMAKIGTAAARKNFGVVAAAY